MRAVDRNAFIFRPAIDEIIVRIAEKQIAAIADPNGAFGEAKPTRQFFYLRIRRNQTIERGVIANDLRFHLLNTAAVRPTVEIECDRFDPDEVRWALRTWAVEAENGNFKFLARLCVARQDHFIWRVPSFDNATAALTQHSGEVAIHPDLGIIINHNFEGYA